MSQPTSPKRLKAINDGQRRTATASTASAKAGSAVNQSVNQTIALAREWRSRQTSGDALPLIRLDFHSLMRVSGRWLMVSDICALVVAFALGGLVALLSHDLLGATLLQHQQPVFAFRQLATYLSFGVVGLLWLDSRGHYRQRLPFWEMFGNLVAVSVFGFVSSGFIEFITKDDTSRLWMGSSWLCLFLLILLGRTMVRHALDKGNAWKIPALIIGEGHSADKTVRALSGDPQMGFDIIAQVPGAILDDLNKPEAWKHLLAVNGACHVFLALSGSEIERHVPAMKAMTRARIPCSIVPPWLCLPSSSLSAHHFMMQDVLLMHDTNRLQLLLPGMIKRFFDIAVSGSALLMLSPILLLVMLGVRRDGGPAFFKQARIGQNGELFQCFKFRSMRVDADAMLEKYLADNPEAAAEWKKFQKLKNDVRITRFGNFIRRTSLDELPQLINVLKGDMSLVGPRPCTPGQEGLYKEDFGYYTTVRPGITGPWQVSGRNRLTFSERVELEAWYVRNWNLWMDIVIMLKTIPAVMGNGQAF